MKTSLFIARRYLFGKKSTNAINLISGISVLGLSIGTAALVLVLSVFNGFEDLITGLFSNFNPDIKVEPIKGKTFAEDVFDINDLIDIDGVSAVSKTIEEVAIFEYKGSQDFGILKGVDEHFVKVTSIDSTLREGNYTLQKELRFKEKGDTSSFREYAVLGAGMRNKLKVNIEDYYSAITVYMGTNKKSLMGESFKKRFIYPAGTFVIQQDFDNQYILSSLDFAREILNAKNKLSSLEIKLDDKADSKAVVQKIQKITGADFTVKDRFMQDEAFLKLMNIEKWMSFAILSLTLFLVAFNLIGSLWMIVLDKKKDIAILKSMGANDGLVRNIFLGQGLMLCLLGMLLGFLIALFLFFIQKTAGIVPIPDGFVVDSYPISIRLTDFLAVAAIVFFIGLLASLLPSLRAQRIKALLWSD